MPLLNSVINWINLKRNYQIQLYCEHPNDIQMEVLLNLLRKAGNTSWGQKYSYGKINSVEAYQKTVPLQTYDDIKPWVERLRNGENDLL